jgi:arginine decarboxylase
MTIPDRHHRPHHSLPLHAFNGNEYLLGAFLVGTYPEILGDLHNLFGDTNAVHVRIGENNEVILDAMVQSDTVREVLDYMQFNARMLLEQFRKDVEAALREGKSGYEVRSVTAILRGAERLHLP